MNARQLKQRFMLHLDPVLLAALGGFMLVSLVLLYSASDGNWLRVLGQLGNIAQRAGRSLQVDPANGHPVGDAEAARLWTREYEPGWEPTV